MAVTSTIENPALARPATRSASRRRLTRSDRLWALAFATPYIIVFAAFVIYPICFGLWLGSDPATYRQLLADPVYPSALLNTLIYLTVAVNLKLFLALLLSGFFMRKGVQEQILMLGMLPATGSSREELQPFINSKIERWGKIVRQVGLAGSM